MVWIASLRGRSGRIGNVSYPEYVAYRDRATTLSGVLAYGGNGLSVGGSRPRHVLGGLVSGNYFDVLGIRAAIGRTFTPADDSEPGAHPVAVISDALWRESFGANPGAVNGVVSINGRPFTIIGVAPRGFTGVAPADNAEQLWVPLAMAAVALQNNSVLLNAPDAAWLDVAGRLREGATVAQADAEMRVIAQQLNPAGTPPDRARSARVLPMQGGLNPSEQRDLGPVFGLIAIVPVLVLLVACANVANVLMARNVSRRKEFALRRAIGASRGRLIRQLLMEGLLLSLLSAGAGFAVSFGLTALIAHYGDVPPEVSTLATPDVRALLATTALSILTTLVFALAPALTATRFEVLPALKDEGVTSTAAQSSARLRRVFVIAQVALADAADCRGTLPAKPVKGDAVDPGFEPTTSRRYPSTPIFRGTALAAMRCSRSSLSAPLRCRVRFRRL
jgi:predicted permease